MLVAVGILSILAAIAITQYQSYKVRVYDTVARSDLKNAMIALENYYMDNTIYPGDFSDLLANGFNFSKDVCFTKFHLHNAGATVHMHIRHTSSPNAWHTKYPDDGGDVDHRDQESCM